MSFCFFFLSIFYLIKIEKIFHCPINKSANLSIFKYPKKVKYFNYSFGSGWHLLLPESGDHVPIATHKSVATKPDSRDAI
jgi:hypothetical protein